MKYSIGDQVIDEDGNEGIVVIRWNDGDICEYENDAAHPNPVKVQEMAEWIESECYCPCCTDSKTCAADCTYEQDNPSGWEHMMSARLARWGE